MSELSEWIESHKDQPEHERVVQQYNMNSSVREREFAEANENGGVVICQHCSYPEIPSRSVEGNSFIKNQCCFDCWYWLHNLNLINQPRSDAVIVDGIHRTDSGMSNERGEWLGHGGSKFYYRKIGETQIRCTNNMWYQGKIPERLNIPDNAVMCTKRDFENQ